MKLVKFRSGSADSSFGCLEDDSVRPLLVSREGPQSLSDILEAENPRAAVEQMAAGDPIPLSDAALLAPIDQQEVWAAGVTYKRSKSARMEESETAASCYDRVYESPRPELFFKASPHRVVGPGQPIRIREDSKWNVPEPEMTLVINSRRQLVGFTAGNDMSSRDIEGDNPLYLPQAKVYNACCGLGPCITLAPDMPEADKAGIQLAIRREGQIVYQGETSAAQMARSFDNLIGWLTRDNSFPSGVFLLTGTGIVPDSDFTLQAGDIVDITIEGVGVLSNPVVQG